MIKAVIYDLDDLMVDSNPLHLRAWEKLLKVYGHEFSELPESSQSKFIGMRVIDISQEIIKYFKLGIGIQEFYGKRVEIFLELVREELKPMPGLIQSIKLLKEKNYKLAIASSGAKKYINLVISKFQLGGIFDIIVTGDDVHKGKPNPETYTTACKKLNILPEDCVVLEDATVGIMAAKSAGCKCIGVKNPHTPPQDLSKADLILSNLKELTTDIINKLGK